MIRKECTLLLFYLCFFLFLCSKDSEANCNNINSSFTTSQTVICGPSSAVISFTNTSTGTGAAGAMYSWYLNGVLFASTTGLTAPATSTISTVGTYTYMLVAFDSEVPCNDTAIVNVFIRPVPVANYTFINNQCGNNAVPFINTSTGTGTYTTYAWSFDDGGTSTLQNPAHAYTSAGTYNVQLTVTNGTGCTNSITQAVSVINAPVAGIGGDDGDGDTEYCLPPADTSTSEVVTFSNFSTGATSFSWNFGDGSPIYTTTSSASFQHTYASYATFHVTMIATGGNGCSDTATLQVVFDKFVSASFVVSLPEFSGCIPHTVTPANASQNADNYVWNFGDGTPPVATTNFAAPSHTYTTSGNFTISVTASNSCNQSVSTVGPIAVVGPPVANFTATPALGCSPQTVTFINTTTGAAPANNYKWDFGDGSTLNNVKIPSPKVYYQGTWTIKLISGSSCGADTVYQTIVVDSLPTVVMTANPLTGCTPLTVVTTNSSFGGGLSYKWYINNSLIDTVASLPNQVFTAPAGTTAAKDSIRLQVSNHCGTNDSMVRITVHPKVVAVLSPLAYTICAGASVTFTQTSQGDSLSYLWDFGNGNISVSASPPAQTYLTPGVYTVLLTVTGYCGIDTATAIITVTPIPTADIVPDITDGCAGISVNFTNNSTTGGTYNWSFSGATPSTSNVYSPGSVIFNTPGNQMVYIKVNVGGCIQYDTIYINVVNLPTPGFTITPDNGCSSVVSAINNTSVINSGDTYTWDFDNGTTSALQNPPAQIFFTTGSDTIYNVKLIISASNGCKDSAMHTVSVHPDPVALFMTSDDTVCAQTTVSFTNNSTNATSYQWLFGDLATSSFASPTHLYSTPGNNTVQLIALTAFGCADTSSALIVIDSVPTAAFVNTTECLGSATQFTNTSVGNNVNISWNFGDGSAPDISNTPSHLYASAGSYNVTLTVTNNKGCTDVYTKTVVVKPVPVAAFTNGTVCMGEPVLFTDQSTGAPTGWKWDFGDGTAINTVQNPLHTYLTLGNYTITLIASGGSGCADTITGAITVNPVPTADFTAASVCTEQTVFFNNTSAGAPDFFVWDFGDGTIDNTNNVAPTHIYTVAGTYNVKLTAGYSSTGCTNSKIISITVFPLPMSAFISTAPCLNVTTQFSDVTPNSPIQWRWNFGDGSPLDTLQNPAHIFSSADTFVVSLVTQNVFGCTDSIQMDAIVNPLPVAAFSFDTVCENTATLFNDQSMAAVSWNWGFGDGATGTTNAPAHIYPGDGTYTVELIVTNTFGCTDTISHSIIVNPKPVSSFAANTACHTYPTVFSDSSALAVAWQWNFGDQTPVITEVSPLHTYANAGSYTVGLTVKTVFGCMDSNTQVITVLQQPQANFIVTSMCARDSIPFTDASLGDSIISWTWNFGDGGADTQKNPIHIFQQSGNYTTNLIVKNSMGCADTVAKQFVVNTIPAPLFSVNPGCYGTISSFTDLSTDIVPINSWFYDFDDGNNSTSQNPNYIFYAGAGVYNVSLTVMNINGCDSSVTIPVTINVVPVANYTADTVCIGTTTTFTDVSTGNPTSWYWTFGDGTNDSTGPVTTHLYTTAGSFLTSLTVSNGPGCSDTKFQIVEVRSDVYAGIITDTSACIDEVLTMIDNSVIAVGTFLSDTWDFGDGTPTVNSINASHAYAAAGNYVLTHTVVSDAGCANTATDTIVIHPAPVANFNSMNTCQIQPSIFTDNSSGVPASWNWNLGDGASSTAQNPVHQYALPDSYTITLIIATAEGCADTTTHAITVYPQPTASFTSNVVCWGDTTTFVNTSTTSGEPIAATWWDFGDGTNAALYSPQHRFVIQNDSFNVTLAIATGFGCVDTLTQMVTTFPISTFNYAPQQTSGCEPFTATFYDSSKVTGGTIVNWLWDFGDGNLTYTPAPTHTYNSAGNYYASLTITNSYGCSAGDTLMYPVVVYPAPVAGFKPSTYQTNILEAEIQFTDNSIGANLWDYSFDDNGTSVDQNPVHIFTDTGTYIITQIAINQFGCKDTTWQSVVVEPIFTAFIPNAFTPNDNDLNESFKPQFFGMIAFNMIIYDRFGNEIFKTNDINEGWNGRIKGVGEIVQRDVYVYKITTKDIFHNNHSYYGGVTLIR